MTYIPDRNELRHAAYLAMAAGDDSRIVGIAIRALEGEQS